MHMYTQSMGLHLSSCRFYSRSSSRRKHATMNHVNDTVRGTCRCSNFKLVNKLVQVRCTFTYSIVHTDICMLTQLQSLEVPESSTCLTLSFGLHVRVKPASWDPRITYCYIRWNAVSNEMRRCTDRPDAPIGPTVHRSRDSRIQSPEDSEAWDHCRKDGIKACDRFFQELAV